MKSEVVYLPLLLTQNYGKPSTDKNLQITEDVHKKSLNKYSNFHVHQSQSSRWNPTKKSEKSVSVTSFDLKLQKT